MAHLTVVLARQNGERVRRLEKEASVPTHLWLGPPQTAARSPAAARVSPPARARAVATRHASPPPGGARTATRIARPNTCA
jgi:hypothetical protein